MLIKNRSAVNPEHCDTAFPSEPQGAHGEKGYFTLRFELSQISSEYVILTIPVRLDDAEPKTGS